jgi:hypothetical protein
LCRNTISGHFHTPAVDECYATIAIVRSVDRVAARGAKGHRRDMTGKRLT